jgi:hypothetical protein
VSELDTKAVLISMLEMLKRQIEYTHLIHGWVIAVNETLEKLDPKYAEQVKQHPFYKGQPLGGQSSDVLTQNIDALIQQLRLR